MRSRGDTERISANALKVQWSPVSTGIKGHRVKMYLQAGFCRAGLILTVLIKTVIISTILERFSIEFRKTKTKVFTQSNYRGCKQCGEPIKTKSKREWQTQRAGNMCERTRDDWCWFYFRLDDKVARVFLSQ